MKKNFSVGQTNELLFDGRLFDLHNWYDFAGLVVFSRNRIQVWFTPNSGNGKNREALVIDVDRVDALEITHRVLLGNCRDLEELGYKNPSDSDLNWLIDEHHATGADHLVFRFGPNDHIRVHGERAQLYVREDTLSRLIAGGVDRA